MSTARTPQVKFTHRFGRRPVGLIPDELLDQVKVVGQVKVNQANVEDVWLEVALDDAWIAAFRLLPQQGQPVIGEVRVFPSESFTHKVRHAGEWISGHVLGYRATVPAGGITTKLIRRLQTSETIVAGLPAWKNFQAKVHGATQHHARMGFRTLRPLRSGKRRVWSDEQLLEAAVSYVEIGGRRPVAELAKQRNLKPTQARDLLNACTEKEFLTPGRRGVASRGLTDKAKKLLAERSQK